jgi:DNA-binding transcriptional LysR family regulator
MELRHLRYFVAVAEELHFSRAAERLRMSQSPLSQQIRQLEDEINTRLFDRTRRSVRLTEAGRTLLEHAREVLARFNSVVREVGGADTGDVNRLTIGCTLWGEFMGIPRLIRRFSEAHPGIRLELRTASTPDQIAGLNSGALHMALVSPPSDCRGLEIEKLTAQPLLVALPAAHRLVARTHLSPRDLAGEPYVALAREVAPAYAAIVTDYWNSAGVAMKPRLEADRPHAIMKLVAAGAGFAVVPASVRALENLGVVCRSLLPAPPPLDLALVWRRDRGTTARAMLEVAQTMSVPLVKAPRRRSVAIPAS